MSNLAPTSSSAASAVPVSFHEAAARMLDLARRRRRTALLVAISGVDGSGKTHLAQLLAERLRRWGVSVAPIGIDPWQNPQTIRFASFDPGAHFYRHAIRFDDLFAQVVDPLVANRSLELETRVIRTDADAWEPLVYAYHDIKVVLLEGIFLFRRDLLHRYDLRIWVDCSLETALRRALERNAENRAVEALRADYDCIYHAAQRVHFALDDPRAASDLLLDNEQDTLDWERRS